VLPRTRALASQLTPVWILTARIGSRYACCPCGRRLKQQSPLPTSDKVPGCLVPISLLVRCRSPIKLLPAPGSMHSHSRLMPYASSLPIALASQPRHIMWEAPFGQHPASVTRCVGSLSWPGRQAMVDQDLPPQQRGSSRKLLQSERRPTQVPKVGSHAQRCVVLVPGLPGSCTTANQPIGFRASFLPMS